jgi:hypothetical protein
VEVLSQQLCGLLVELWSLAWSLPGLEGAAFVELLAVTLDGSAIDSAKCLAVSDLGTPFLTDSTIFSLRSNEYAFISLRYPAQHHRNPL